MGIFQTLVTKYKDSKQKQLNKQQFKADLFKAVEDGKLTSEEIEELDNKKTELGLSDEDVNKMRSEVFLRAFSSAKSDAQVTAQEEQELESIQKYLGLEDSEVEHTKKELARLRLLNEIQQGNLPIIGVTNLVTTKGEQTYWSEPAILAEEKVIRRSYKGGSSGVSFRIMKGVSYRVGSSRGHLVSETDIVPVSDGELILTNKRVIFRGDGKSFVIKLDRLLDLQLYSNGVYFSEPNKSKPRMVKFKEEGNHDIIGAILSYAINNYNSKA